MKSKKKNNIKHSNIKIKQYAGSFLKENSKKFVNRIGEILITANKFSNIIDRDNDETAIKKIMNFQRDGKKIFTRHDSLKVIDLLKKIKKNLKKSPTKKMIGGKKTIKKNYKLKGGFMEGFINFIKDFDPKRIEIKILKPLEGILTTIVEPSECGKDQISIIDISFMMLGSIWIIGGFFDFIGLLYSLAKRNWKTAFIIFLNRLLIFSGDSVKIAYLGTCSGIKEFYKNLHENSVSPIVATPGDGSSEQA